MAADLDAIRIKIRRLTRSPSDSQITNVEIDEYVNTFILYDFPEHLRLFTLRENFTFFTEPYVHTYSTNVVDPADPLYDFENKYITTHRPVYIAGYPTTLMQSQEQFYNMYPIVRSIASIGVKGNGVITNFAGTLNRNYIPMQVNAVLFSSIDLNDNGLELHDDGEGILEGDGAGTIDYLTGDYTLQFSAAPGDNETINSQTVPYVPSMPKAILYFDNSFVLRPIPDQPYEITMEVYVRPTALLAGAEEPELQQWWQYIAYGAAKKIFEDRMDVESVAMIMPEFTMQERLVLRRVIVQQTKERVATIYSQQVGGGNNHSGWGNW